VITYLLEPPELKGVGVVQMQLFQNLKRINKVQFSDFVHEIWIHASDTANIIKNMKNNLKWLMAFYLIIIIKLLRFFLEFLIFFQMNILMLWIKIIILLCRNIIVPAIKVVNILYSMWATKFYNDFWSLYILLWIYNYFLLF
jgi:hypothetical protein